MPAKKLLPMLAAMQGMGSQLTSTFSKTSSTLAAKNT